MLLKHPWLRDAKASHDWGTNIATIQGTGIITLVEIDQNVTTIFATTCNY
jgi:hypothetical protein